MLKRPLCLLFVSCLAAPAGAADKDLTRQLLELQSQVLAQDTRLNALEAARVQRDTVLNLVKEVEALKAEIARLHGTGEEQAHQLELLEKRQKDLYVDLDQRLAEQTREIGKLVEQSKPAPPPAVPAVDPAQESSSYDAALEHFKARDYAAAITAFKDFLKAYPASTLAANAQYWIGYSHYAQKEYASALAQQQKLIALYPDNPKVPDAMLNIASSQIELRERAAAKKTLAEIIAKYPGSNAAGLAAKRLASLK